MRLEKEKWENKEFERLIRLRLKAVNARRPNDALESSKSGDDVHAISKEEKFYAKQITKEYIKMKIENTKTVGKADASSASQILEDELYHVLTDLLNLKDLILIPSM